MMIIIKMMEIFKIGRKLIAKKIYIQTNKLSFKKYLLMILKVVKFNFKHKIKKENLF